MQYRIEDITDLLGKPKWDDRNLSRIGREGSLITAMEGCRMEFQYSDTLDTLVTSEVDRVLQTAEGLAVRTKHAIYYLKRLDSDPEYPELVDLEEDDL